MIAIKNLLALISILTVIGCSAVYSTYPMGETTIPLNTDEWKGTWIHSEGSITIDVTDTTNGVLQIAWIENMKIKSYRVQLLKAGKWLFGNVKDDNNGNRYIWGRVSKNNHQIVLWAPTVSKFRNLIENGILPGTVDADGNVTLDQLTAKHFSKITSESEGILFDWDDPVVLMRLAN